MLKIKRILALVLVMTLVCTNVPWTAAAAALTQEGEEVVLTEQTILPEELEKKEEISTDAPASNAVGMPSVEVYIQAPEYQVGDRIPAPEEIALDITGGIRGEVSGFWEYGEEEVFQSNRYYYLELSVIAPEGVTFEWDTLDLRSNGCLASTNITDGSVLHVLLEYDMYPPRVGEVWVHGLPQQIRSGEAQLPMDLSVEGEATIISMRWLDEEAEETDSFVDGHDYFLELVVVGNDGYWLDPYASVYDADMEPNHMYLPDAPFADVPTFTPDENKIRVYRPYSLKQSAGPVQISVSGVAPGSAVEDVLVQATGEVEIDYYSIKDMYADEELETGTFEREKYYTVLMQMNINEGFTHLRDIEVALGECENISNWYYIINAWSLTAVVEYDFSTRELGYFSVEGMPEEIQPGAALIPELYATTGVRFSQIRWLDADKQPVTEFVDGNYYYLEVTMETEAGYVFAADVKVDNWQMDGNYQCVSERKVVATCRYSLEPVIGSVGVSVFNVEPGKQVGDIIAEVSNQATVENIEVFDLLQDKYLSDSDTVEDDMYLQVTVTLKANDGYRFTYDTQLSFTPDNTYGTSWVSGGGQLMFAAVEFDLRDPAIRNLWVAGLPEELQPGVNQLPDLYVEEGHCTIDSVRWMDEEGQTVTSMEANKVYGLEVVFTPDDGYAFRDYVYLDCDKYEILDNGKLRACWFYSLAPVIENVELSVSGVAIGAPVNGVDIQVTEGAVIDSYYFICSKGEVTDGYFEESEYYELVITLYPPEGYRFSEQNRPYVNGSQDYGYSMGSGGSSMVIYVAYDFYKPAVENIWVDLLPTNEDITAGAAQIPTLRVKDGYVTIESVRWVDENKQPVTAFVKGNDYFLEITFAPMEGYEFRDNVYIEENTSYDEVEIVSPEKLVYYRGYSLKPSVGAVNLQVSGYAVGKPVSNLKVEVIGKAKVVSTVIYNETSGRLVTSGNFEAGQVYLFEFALDPVDGYRFADDTEILINDGDLNAYQNDGGRLYTGMYFNTCEMIDSVTLNMGKVEIGKNVDACVPTAPNGAKYSVEYYYWTDHAAYEEVAGKFEDGHKYYLGFILRPAKGYAFSGDLTVTVGGQKADAWANEIGAFCEGGMTYSFLEKITKVELPAMPDSIKKGSTLPTSFNVSSDKYTFEYMWISVLDDAAVTKAEKDGSYLLAYFVDAAQGYEFADDVDIYIGGKLSQNVIMEGSTLQAFKVYNLGVPEVKRVDLTIPAPAVGEKPGKVTVPTDANYEVEDAYWYQNTSGEVYDSDEEIKTFQDGKYVLLTMSIVPAEGYFLSSELEIYVNGKKMTDTLCVSMSLYGAFAVNLGEVGVAKPMQAPVVKVEGQTLTWQADSNATGYEIYRATSKSGKYSKVDTIEGNAWVDTGATVGKTYYYKVKAVNTGNSKLNSDYSSVVSMAAMCAAPALEVHVESESGKPVASWNKVTGAKSYELWRATSVDGKYTKLTTTTKLTYTDTKATVGIEYYYKVKAIASSSKYNSEFSGIWMSCAICAKPSVSIKVDIDTGKPSLTWKAVSGADAYQILRQTAGAGEFIPIAICEGTAYQDLSAAIDTCYTYKIQALGAYEGLNSAYSKEVEAVSGLARPALTSKVNDNGKPEITWQAVEGAVSYNVYRSTSSGKSYTIVHTTSELTYVDGSVAAGKTYYYKLEAVGENSKSAQTSYVKLTGKCDIPVLDVQAGSTGKPVLTWNKISGAKKYEIWRSVDGAAFKKLTTTTKTSYTDTKATNGAECTYKVKALGSSSSYNGLFSEVKGCFVTCAAPSLTAKVDTATGKPSLSWGKVTGASGYDIYRSVNGGAFELLTNVIATSYLDEATKADNKYTYYIVSVGKAEVFNSVKSAEKTVTVTVGQPKLTGTINEQGKAVITWQAVEDAVKYEVYRSTSSSKSYKLVTTVTDLTYTDTGITAGKTYYYKVVAVGQNSESAQSAYVKLTGKCDIPVLDVQAGSTGKPVLTWNKISGAKKYEIWRSVDGAAFKKLTTTTKTSYTDTKATDGAECTYKVKALGSSSSYNGLFSEVKGCYVTCAAPSLTAKVDTATGKPSLSWGKVTGAVSYDIYRSVNGGAFELLTNVAATSYLDEATKADNKYTYYVVTVGKAEVFNSVKSAEKTVTVTVGQPKLTGTINEQGKAVITWQAVEDAVKYEVYRSTSSSKSYKLVTTVTDLTYTDTGITAGKTYYYKVVAVGSNSKSAQSAYVKLTGKCAQPEIDVQIDETSGKPVITWGKISGAKKYEIYRSTDGVKFSKLTTTTKLTYTDTKAAVGTAYTYKVRAVGSKSSYNSIDSAVLTVTAKCAMPVVTLKVDTVTGKPTLTWKAITGAIEYGIYFDDGEGYSLISVVEGTKFTDEDAYPGQACRYYVVAYGTSHAYDSAWTKTGTVTATCAQPKLSGGLTPDGKPYGTWESVANAESYVVYRSTKSSSGYKQLDISTEYDMFFDESAVKGKTYYYKIVAVSGGVHSAMSNYIKVKSK